MTNAWGRQRRRWALTSAVTGRYPHVVVEFRRRSRHTTVRSRPITSAISRSPNPALIPTAICALSANVNMAALKWVLTPREFVALRKVKDTADRYLLQADPTADGVFRLWGAPVIVTGRIPDDETVPETPTGRAALVDFSQIAVARDLAPSVKILDQTFGDYDQQAIRVVARYDAAPLNPEAIVTLTGITV